MTVRENFERVIGPMRESAREVGYAIGVHGSLARDIDLIGVPWTEDAIPAYQFACRMREVCEQVTGAGIWGAEPQPRPKPHGRKGWTFYIGGGSYIDLSVMPLNGH